MEPLQPSMFSSALAAPPSPHSQASQGGLDTPVLRDIQGPPDPQASQVLQDLLEPRVVQGSLGLLDSLGLLEPLARQDPQEPQGIQEPRARRAAQDAQGPSE